MKTAILHIRAIGRSRRLRISLLKKLIKGALWSGFGGVVLVLLCNWRVVKATENRIFFDIKTLPSNDVGLVLGTSKYVARGKENLFFKYRMEASALLFKEGKVKYLILSGNKEAETYDEPKAMKQALLKLGVPEEAIWLDTAGYRTYDSVLRCRQVYGQQRVTVISQNFHNARALYLAQHEGLDAIGFAAQDVPDGYSFKTLLREYLARPKAMLDVYVLKPTPGVRED
ncbi:MAG: vancomycin high temperature exclusion protein [Runella sp.]